VKPSAEPAKPSISPQPNAAPSDLQMIGEVLRRFDERIAQLIDVNNRLVNAHNKIVGTLDKLITAAGRVALAARYNQIEQHLITQPY
jgi:hypothetical protein